MKHFLLIYLSTLILFGLVNTSSTGTTDGSSNSTAGGSTDQEYAIAASYDSARPYPFLPAFENFTDELECDTYVTDFASNGADRIIIVGTTLSNKYIRGESGCMA